MKIINRERNNEFEGFEPQIGVIYKTGFEKDLSSIDNNIKFYPIGENLGMILTKPYKKMNINRIAALKTVVRAESLSKIELLGKISQGTSKGVNVTEEIGANFFKNNPNFQINGRGVLIGIIDSGIDYLHEDFIYPDGTSKIMYLWDQTKDGKPPQDYFIGTEYTKEDINVAIANKDSTLSVDEEGHGTMMSGICAGLGNVNKSYSGIAEEAELVVVKMKKINGYYYNAFVYVAAQYIAQKAAKLKMPVVINFSSGSNFSVGLNAGALTNPKFSPYLTRGLCLVGGSGNEGNTQTHATGKVKFKGDTQTIDLEVAEEEKSLEVQIVVNKPDKMIISMVSPSGETSKIINVSSYNETTGIFDYERTRYSIIYTYPTASSGQQEARIRMTSVKKGIWKIHLTGEYITNGVYHMYLPNKVFLNIGTKFSNPDPYYTITDPATYQDVITIGGYDNKNKSLWATSSRGPTIDGLRKPAIVAPCVDIIAPYPGNKYAKITGTSVASAHVCGSVALYLQYTVVENMHSDRAFAEQIRTYLKAGATRNPNIIYPNFDYGYGVLNIKGMFDQLI